MLWAEFLENVPPNTEENIEDLFVKTQHGTELRKSGIRIHCWSETCSDVRIVTTSVTPSISGVWLDENIAYMCIHCWESYKYYSVRCWKDDGDAMSGRAIKFGEIPAFGPPVPSKVISLIGPDRELFLRGRRSENQGLGIGAFAYYRQIIERQTDRLLTEIKKVAQRLNASPHDIELFDQAIKETQFSKAIESVKAAIPQSLLIDGHNPLTLLHSVLSRNIHMGTDEECLESAQDIRVILTELAERITVALKDQAELKQSLARLLSRGQNKLEDQRNN
jgi:hypothetical protein